MLFEDSYKLITVWCSGRTYFLSLFPFHKELNYFPLVKEQGGHLNDIYVFLMCLPPLHHHKWSHPSISEKIIMVHLPKK